MQLVGKKILITGASRGIGEAIARAVAKHNSEIILLARGQEALSQLAKDLSASAKTHCFAVDLRDLAAVKKVALTIKQELGGIDILINNAGTGAHKSVLKSDPNEWQGMMNVNLLAPMLLTHLFLPEMLQQNLGAVINIASMAGLAGVKDAAAYSASKFGLRGFTQSLFEEVREYNIKVCAICPGFVDTVLVPASAKLVREEMIEPGAVAEAVLGVLQMDTTQCVTEVIIRPQASPYRNRSEPR